MSENENINYNFKKPKALLLDLKKIKNFIINKEKKWTDKINKVPTGKLSSAHNFLHYLALRQIDLRKIQNTLSSYGLSSLGRSESHVLNNLNEVIHRLEATLGKTKAKKHKKKLNFISATESEMILAKNSSNIFGAKHPSRNAYIMVTASDAEEWTSLHCEKLIKSGMNLTRINCAHGNAEDWLQIINNVKMAARKNKKNVKILMDLAGPKIRTLPIWEEEPFEIFKPKKNKLEEVTAPALIPLIPLATEEQNKGQNSSTKTSCLILPNEWLSQFKVGDTIKLKDSRGKKRKIRIEIQDSKFIGVSDKKICLCQWLILHWYRKKKKMATYHLQQMNAKESKINISEGTGIFLTSKNISTLESVHYKNEEYFSVGCSIPEILSAAEKGHRIIFDDGKIHTVVIDKSMHGLYLKTMAVKGQSASLKGEKGINFPDTQLPIPGFTPEDKKNLPFVLKHADMVGLSFVQEDKDIKLIQDLIHKSKRTSKSKNFGIVVKIETSASIQNLSKIILQSLQSPAVAIMIARGDLAVECGFERLAELQEETLCFCEAAHIPVIWATQVLEGLVKDGIPSRAEITDAAMSARAECVMLNKGPFILKGIKTLDDILKRMESHQHKRSQLYRPLHIATKI